MKPILSIVIPTKNRHIYLKSFIKTFIGFDSSNIELIIQDNSDDNYGFNEYITRLSNNKIKYFYTKESISISENCDLAVKNSTGEYVCMIGDDDSVSSYILPITLYMKENDIDSAIFKNPKYMWSNVRNKPKEDVNLIIYECDGSIKEIDVELEISKILNNCARTLGSLPKLYYGIIRRDVLSKLYNVTKTYFPGPSPDMANAIGLAFNVSKTIHIDLPIMIGGVSSSSTWEMSINKKHKGNLKDIKHLPKNIEDDWESIIPKIWTVQTIWFISAIKAIRALGKDEYIEKFKYEKFASDFFCYNFEYRKMLYPLLKGKPILIIKFGAKVFSTTIFRVARLVKNKFMPSLNLIPRNVKIYKNVESTYEASRLVDDYIEKNVDEWKLVFLKK